MYSPFKFVDIIGICAMDSKARSKPMRNILNRLTGDFDVIIFGDKVILDEEKAIKYVELFTPFCVNDLVLQKLLWDRRLVLDLLQSFNVSTPKRLVVSRDGGPDIKFLNKPVYMDIRERLGRIKVCEKVEILDQDTIRIGSEVLVKPFVEKPVSGEDHNINIYYHSKDGGGTRRLFRKVGNKSSEFDPSNNDIRMDSSYIYEVCKLFIGYKGVYSRSELHPFRNQKAIPNLIIDRSPVVDGVVRRNADGKEMRYVTELNEQEQEIARKTCYSFGQQVCGLDLLRMDGRSYVIDVNGWSFVKGNEEYYESCAMILKKMFNKQTRKERCDLFMKRQFEQGNETAWILKGLISVFRHADRTPKQKAKFTIKNPALVVLLNGDGIEEAILKTKPELHNFYRVIKEQLLNDVLGYKTKYEQILAILDQKLELKGTKVQVKPNVIKGLAEKFQIIVKWGGEFTHAAVHHSTDLGENMRKDLCVINKGLLNNVQIYSSSERRCTATANAFCAAFLQLDTIPTDFVVVRKELLDDSNEAKDLTDKVKVELMALLQNPRPALLINMKLPEEFESLKELADKIRDMLLDLRSAMWANFDTIKGMELDWCCSESPRLFKERWEKLIEEYCDVESTRFDPGKICELYDSLKYDALHNRLFLMTVFKPLNSVEEDNEKLRELYRLAKLFFDLIAPQEYGISDNQKLNIGMQTSGNLLMHIYNDLNAMKTSENPLTRLYFTKDLTQITFELYECTRDNNEKEWSLRLGFSPGAHHSSILDLQMDHNHALSVAYRSDLTEHIQLNKALDCFGSLLDRNWNQSLV